MNWYKWIESRRMLLISGMSTISFVALMVAARRNIASFDSFWHLQMGKDWIENGLSPWVDHYSFTFAGADISSPPVIFQAVLYWFVAQFGQQTGYELLKFACYALTLTMVLLYLRQVRAPTYVYLIVLPLAVSLIELRALVRPELLTYPLLVVALMLYHRAGREVSAKTVLPMAALMLLWVNHHSSVLGYVVLFGFFLDAGWRQLTERAPRGEWLRWLAWGLLIVAVGFLRPGFTHPVLDQLAFSPEWKTLIQEYESPVLYRSVAAIYALVAIVLISLVLAVRQQRFGYLAVLAVMIYGASTMARLVTPAGIVAACIFADLVTREDWRRWSQAAGALGQDISKLGVTALVVLPLWTSVDLARDYMAENRTSGARFPWDVVGYMKDTGRSGRIFNEYQVGGFLIHQLSPESTVYIDGRTEILYPPEHYRRLKQAQASSQVLQEEIDAYGITLAVVENTPANFMILDEVEGFALDYAGSAYSLFAGNDAMLPVFGHLFARPACWQTDMVPALESEGINAVINLQRDSALWPFVNAVMAYARAEDPAAYLEELAPAGLTGDNALRFAAYRALEQENYPKAIALLQRVGSRQLKDVLAAALATMRQGEFDQAEQIIKFASETGWQLLELADVAVAYGLLIELQAQRPLKIIDAGYPAELEKMLGDAGVHERDYVVSVDLFCARAGWSKAL